MQSTSIEKLALETIIAAAKRQIDNIPLGRYGMPEELANVVVFLGSARASFVSGQTILIDGAATRAIF